MLDRSPDLVAAHVADAVSRRLAQARTPECESDRAPRVAGQGRMSIHSSLEAPIDTPAGRFVVHHVRDTLVKHAASDSLVLVVVVLKRAPDGAGRLAALRDSHGLTRREIEVAALLARRHSNAEIAAALGISRHTARHHAERILRKLRVRARGEAVRVLTGEGMEGAGEPFPVMLAAGERPPRRAWDQP